LKETPKVDAEAINKRKQKRLAKSIADEDLGLDNFGITWKIKKIMVEQQKKKKTRKQFQRDEEEEMLANEHQTKRRYKSISSALAHPPAVNPIAQRLKDLSETDDDGEGLVRVAFQK